MTNTERIQANNAELRECIELAENLPDAGSGGSADVVLQTKRITPTKESQTVSADTGYDGLRLVVVDPIPNDYVITTDANAVSADMRKGKTAYVKGEKVTGNIEDFNGSYECSGDSTGGGTSSGLKTCTVTAKPVNGTILETTYTIKWSAEMGIGHGYLEGEATVLENAVCGTFFIVVASTNKITLSNATIIFYQPYGDNYRLNCLVKAQ